MPAPSSGPLRCLYVFDLLIVYSIPCQVRGTSVPLVRLYGSWLTLVFLRFYYFLSVSSRVCLRDGASRETDFAVEAHVRATVQLPLPCTWTHCFAFDLLGVLRERRRFRELAAVVYCRQPRDTLKVTCIFVYRGSGAGQDVLLGAFIYGKQGRYGA